ncbi:hypothetical protein KsCSTR_32800 [Candidatus Kuenenia stuttgartiensis]|uniref:Uncharacterized protein n=1 Tax=Kuenenia stuttgartiensis TaxID=174633 RepID=A0A6G7GTQ8_KUEST|nr:hypothetical protein KsCSTR_32800 [Candidatus Kuenenia stuttgartiensis]
MLRLFLLFRITTCAKPVPCYHTFKTASEYHLIGNYTIVQVKLRWYFVKWSGRWESNPHI